MDNAAVQVPVPSGAMRVSVLHRNRPTACLDTVAALRASRLPLAITVVDNASSAENVRSLTAALPAEVEVMKLPENIGWGPAHNLVLRRWLEREDSEFCIVAAHDARPEGDCLERVVRELETHPHWGMACPQYAQPELPCYSVLRGARLHAVPAPAPGAVAEVDYCHGTLAVFRRACLREIGVFDESFFAYGDETEIGLRARRLGWKVGLVWGAVLTNATPAPNQAAIAYFWTRNTLRLARQYGGMTGLLARTAVVLGVTLRDGLKGVAPGGIGSPPARALGMLDYYCGRTGGLPKSLARYGKR